MARRLGVDEPSTGRFLDVDGEVDSKADLVFTWKVEGVGVVGESSRFVRYRSLIGGAAWFIAGLTPVPISVAAKNERATSHAHHRQPT